MTLSDNGPAHDQPDETSELEKALDVAAECLEVVLRNRGLELERVLINARVHQAQPGHRDAAFLFTLNTPDDVNDETWRRELLATLHRTVRAVERA